MDLENKRTEIINRMLKTSGKSMDENVPKETVADGAVAIIGMSGYLPQSMNIREFWDALDADRSLIDEIPNSRINWKDHYDPSGKDPDKSFTKWGGIIPDIRNFDPEFFGILPGEAALMDPRKRLLLMSVYHAMEDAGYAPGSFKNSNTGVFIAIEEDEYNQCMREAGIDVKAGSGSSSSLIANQISWSFDLRGPSEVVNTMCSGGAVAIHRAVNALKTGMVPVAIVGAANLLLHADPFVFLSATGQMSPEPSVRSFGKDARGFLRADGVTSIILKPLSAAVADGDAIYAVIRHSAVNYNGRGGMSMAMPNIPAHTDLIRTCYTEAGIDPQKIGYIEAQGMGNPVADLAEWEACNQALDAMAKEKELPLKSGSCRISTLKPMLGHMHAASAMGALLKIIRSFQTNKIHKIIGLNEVNPDLDVQNRPCRLLAATEDWPEEKEARLAGLHSYGSGGNNAHLLLEEYKPRQKRTEEHLSVPVTIPFSANTEEQCKKAVQQLLHFMVQYPEHALSSIAYTMQTGRDAMKHRIAFMALTRNEFIQKAGDYLEGKRALNDLPAAVQAWVEGATAPWSNNGVKPVRVHLPGYPFNSREYWIDTPGLEATGEGKWRSLEDAEEIVRELLNIFFLNTSAGINLDRQFSDLGFDSMMVIKLSHALNQRYGVAIEPAAFFELTTPRHLVRYINGRTDEMKQRPPQQDTPAKGAIAIIGISGNFPGSPSPAILWQHLVKGNNCIVEVPGDRWSASEHFHPDKETANRAGKSYGKWGGFIKDFYHFDPLFFKISPSETELMSPKERIFLQCAWNVLEDAGLTPQALSGERVGVFAGVTRGGIDPYKTSMFTISNRVSYVLNLNGPSMTIDTACSSSLVAIHEACQHILSGECNMALAGGVHAFLDPSHFAVLSSMYMLSPDGLSKSFGDKANGMVPGEGAGIILLKPLEKAIADKDFIYGVIKGSAINHGGKANGFTVPNPAAQQQLIENALQKAGVSARHISYVEAHGTGTPLGDPIEIRGLTEAFKKDTADTGYCRIGSIKSNIGHLEAAAGVSGLIKILLQMKHKKLVPSLHSRELNPQINFSTTPFIVQQALEDWLPKDKDGHEITRMACVSSFGAGGTNAHIVLEEYQDEEIQKKSASFNINNGTPCIILLSAKNKDRLQELAKQLLNFLHPSVRPASLDLADLAYTLRIGRVALEEKLAIEVLSLEDLEKKLKGFLSGQLHINVPFDWNKQFEWPQDTNKLPRRIPVPGYPFAKEYYGLPEITIGKPTAVSAALHPLVHANTSTFHEQKFSSLFTGGEFFLRDHVIAGEKFLPGVAYLEMAHTAMGIAAIGANREQEEYGTFGLRNVAWIQPIAVGDEPVTIHLRFYKDTSDGHSFEIYSSKEGSDNSIYSQGSVMLKERIERPVHDIGATLNAPGLTSYTRAVCYELFAGMGITYGPAHTVIDQLYAAKHHILAQLSLPAVVSGTLNQFTLHPSLLDGSLQSIMGFMIQDRDKYKDGIPVMIPFALEELIVFHPCTENMWAFIQMNEGARTSSDRGDFDSMSFDIDLMDGSGKVCVRMKRYTARMLRKTAGDAGAFGTLLIKPGWEEQVIQAYPTATNIRIIDLPAVNGTIDQYVGDCTTRLFEELQGILKSRPREKVLLRLTVPGEGEHKTLAALYGLLKTAETENPLVSGELIIRENGRKLVRVMHEYTPEQKEAGHPWKDEGVYLITGGMGGLGLIFAREILSQTKGARLILTGRTCIDEVKQGRLNELLAIGVERLDGTVRGAVEYRQVDVADAAAVNAMIQDICRQAGQINGIIHCAGTLNDNFIINKHKDSLPAVLSPKIQGLVNLDHATKHLSPDIFILCSSSTAVMGNAGQGDYAVANAFMDEYAFYRNTLVSNNERHGHTLAVNWPLWKDGGMQVDETTAAMMFEKIGMTPLDTAGGLRALYHAIASGHGQMMVMHGDKRRLRAAFFSKPESEPLQAAGDVVANAASVLTNGIHEKAIVYFKKLLSGAIKLPSDRIDAHTPLDQYGIDSIMVMKMTGELEKVFGSLPKTLFFEYQDISELTEYFIASYTEKLNVLLGTVNKEATVAKTPETPISDRFTSVTPRAAEKPKEDQSPDIAIIGVSGRYPGARDLKEFWDNLRNGKNSIREIPEERWDHSLYFDADKKKAWKTYSKWGGFLDGVDEFDPLFFNISPREAELLDPQERLFLQCVYEAMEDAGYTRQLLGSNVGVYAGVMWNEYQLYAAQETALGRPLALSSSPSSIANRVSYFCNFNGPSMAVDTMCSSSLTAIHLACQSLRQGGCEVAIAGGVNVTIHPNKYLVLGYGKVASSKGLCESFGKGGDGYVPSEGVGAVLLKPLSKAIADRDHIYGVVKGTSINHGGKVNGYTVPNPKAQTKVVNQALKESGFDPRTISYVEAHGTGTALGDPIEIAGLCGSFNSSDRQFCAIGSVKSNIGHCESAAGIAGVTKVLLQMQYGQIVPSLHSKELNPGIDFENSPFMVQQTLTEWKRPVLQLNGKTGEYPRRAGVSSFGAGGSNAHVVIEEYLPNDVAIHREHTAVPNPVAILLSARTEDRLKEQARQLLAAIQHKTYADEDLANMAYTLQVGREAMEDRLAMEVTSMRELEEKLTAFVHGHEWVEDLYVGKTKIHKEIMSFINSDEDIEKAIENWLVKKKYAKLSALWVKGYDVDWEKLYTASATAATLPRRISLPLYPFVRNRYWPTMGNGLPSADAVTDKSYILHPLVHQNTSTFAEQKFSSTFHGGEFFLKDHLVQGEKVLPGVAYVEMISAAMAMAGEQEGTGVHLENMVWEHPLMVNGHPEKVDIGLTPLESGKIGFAIQRQPDMNGGLPLKYSQGIVSHLQKSEPSVLDVDAIKSLMNRHVLSADACYDLFSKMGITYGPSHQSIETIYIGDKQALARLRLPKVVASTMNQYYLHPSLMDAALQAVIGLLAHDYANTSDIPLAIPFAVKSLLVADRCTSDMWAYIRFSDIHRNQVQTQDIGQLSFNIDLCDATGKRCVLLQEFTTRILRKGARSKEDQGMLMIAPYWQQKEIELSGEAIPFAQRLVVVIGNGELAASLSNVQVVHLQDAWASTAAGFENYAIQIFREVKQLLVSKPKNPVLVQIVVPVQQEKQVLLAVAGLLKTAAFENPLFTGQVIGYEQREPAALIIDRLAENSKAIADTVIRYRSGNREVFSLREYSLKDTPAAPVWKDQGVYLISGGAGGLGLIFTNEIALKTKGATVILTGRSLLSEELETRLNEIRLRNVRVEYRQADISNDKTVEHLVQNILQEFGKLDGIIHSAGVIRDNFILKKSEEEIREVLSPKTKGLFNLDLATSQIPLDFFIICSSSTGITGNAGQADYAMANAFIDRYASYRETLVKTGQRSGKTLSVNWPLWKEGGMQIPKENEKLLLEHTGMVPMATNEGLNALYQAMGADTSQMMVMQGVLTKLRAVFLGAFSGQERISVQPDKKSSEAVVVKADGGDAGRQEALDFFRKILSVALKLPAEEIDPDKAMEEYGIDSVMVMQMTNELEKVFGSLSKTLFFEYQNISELTSYFQQEFPDQLSGLLSPRAVTVEVEAPKNGISKDYKHRFSLAASTPPPKKPATGALDIAIIGLSGTYPQARDIEGFWRILKEGKNCITEIPTSRWDHSKYFDREKNQPGKTYGKWGGFLDGVDEFDPLFFNITPKEAAIMDPQERLFLQCVYETMEDAGYARLVPKNTGVFVGVMNDEYQLYGPQETALGRPLVLSGNSASIANRASYFFNFNGPSIALNTMCSSSLTAIHLACQSLLLGECETAIAGGVNVNIHPNKYVGLAYGKFLSSKGLCESFGAGGDGYVPGEGVGAILLKPLQAALADKDHIYGVIKGTAINHGGKTNGYTVPNPVAQGNTIAKAIKMAGFDPQSISYLEAHGTGTSLGDPIEITGLKRAFDTKARQFCSIGSVKTNIGHCESAAGIAGITKVLLQMKHGKLAPSLHAEELNPHIDFANSPFLVQKELADWERPVLTTAQGTVEVPRRAGVSSFGAGGANAHILIEEYIPDANDLANGSLPVSISSHAPVSITLYAKRSIQLKQQAQRLLRWIQELKQPDIHKLADLAFSLHTGREVMEERLTIEASSFLQLKERLSLFTAGDTDIEGVYTGTMKEAPPIDWSKPGEDRSEKTYRPKKISLPTYPFERRRCWFEQPAAMAEGGVFLEKRWELSPPVGRRGSCNQAAILYNTETKQLATALEKQLSGAVLINIHDETAFQLNRLKETAWMKFDAFIDLVGCSRSAADAFEFIPWLQHLIEYGDRKGIRILGVTAGLSAFQNNDINLAGACCAGLYRMLSSEYSHVISAHVDIEDHTAIEISVSQLLTELFVQDGELEVCYRNGKRYLTSLQETPATTPANKRLRFSGEQVLWITGGTRGLGYLCAQHFVREYGVKRLVLTGQETIPSRDQWPAYKDQDSPLAQKIKDLIALESMGAAIQVLSVPLTNKMLLLNEVNKIKEAWGGIHGILHCAGIGDHDNPAFIRKSLAGIQKVMAPKVEGLNNLYECFKNEPLKFFILFSSVSAVIPSLGAGQAAYAMANGYMDYFAMSRRHSCPLISIQWPSWKETGMGEVRSKAYQLTGLRPLTNAEGLQLLDQIIHAKPGAVVLPACIVSDIWDPGKLLNHPLRIEQPVVDNKPASSDVRAQVPVSGNVREWLTGLFAKELKLETDDLRADKSFQDYGIDSILITQLLHQVQKELGQDIDPSVLFEYTTIATFGDWLQEKFPVDLNRILSNNKQEPVSTSVKKMAPAVSEPTGTGNGGDIAVVGMACRFPGAKDLDAYWNLLKEGRSAIQAVPRERWNCDNSYNAGLIDDPYSFDPKYFFLHEEDARAMDPQALLVLEESLKLFCHAGYTPEEIKGRSIGVYIGGRSKHVPDREQLNLTRNPILTIGQNYLSSNISQFFDLRGPSIVVDTACSSALVAMNMAIQALQNKETEAAVVGGVNLLSTEDTHRLFEQRGLLNKSSEFHLLDKRAGGIVLGEGAGMVLLKTVEQARKAGDHIYAIIKSIAINNDGRTAGPATPNIEAQREIMQTALAKCNKKPEDISYIEVNGSGSEITDLIEMKAISTVYRSSSSVPCQLGSVKPNIGHPLCAEGIAGFIKVVAMLHNQQLVPFLSGHQPMKFFDMSASPFGFSRALSNWPEAPAIAAINCFADGGTNAHVIVEAWQGGNGEENAGRKPLPVPALRPHNLRHDTMLHSIPAVNDQQSIWETFQ